MSKQNELLKSLKISRSEIIIVNAIFLLKTLKLKLGLLIGEIIKSHLLTKDIFVQRVIWNYINGLNKKFLTSNIVPQDHNFNNVVWSSLEQKVR